MKRLITICAVVLMLSAASVSWATPVPVVTHPSDAGAPSWWNSTGGLYAYGYWQSDILGGSGPVSPPDDPTHWATNYLPQGNAAFTANIGIENDTIAVNLANVSHEDLYKQIYIYITGTTESTEAAIITNLNPDSGVFTGDSSWNIGTDGLWHCRVLGEIHPQPDYAYLTVNVPGMTSVTNIWAGELCVPEPATIAMLGLGALSLLRSRKRKV
ncbi:MAG: PEP-CTERM sorting domain-containing protein [Sedimentisphaerales bacterium]